MLPTAYYFDSFVSVEIFRHVVCYEAEIAVCFQSGQEVSVQVSIKYRILLVNFQARVVPYK